MTSLPAQVDTGTAIPTQVLSPTIQLMEHMVTKGETNEEEASVALAAITVGNRARVYSLVDGRSINTECYMQFYPGGKLGFLQFICTGNDEEHTMNLPLNSITDIWLGRQTVTLAHADIPAALADFTCTMFFYLDGSTTEINFSTETAES
uniref:Uncharacterized protein n=1 Tax=Lygus hesperus TaxID=30085 RepID=A0A146MCB0_LYGHE